MGNSVKKIEPKIKKYLYKIDAIILEISKSSLELDLDEFSKLVAQYNKELNSLLSIYHEKKESQRSLKPYIIFYRQFFQELITIVSSEPIKEENLELIRIIISQKTDLIKNFYQAQAEREFENIEKVSPELEKCLKKRLEKQEKSNYYT